MSKVLKALSRMSSASHKVAAMAVVATITLMISSAEAVASTTNKRKKLSPISS